MTSQKKLLRPSHRTFLHLDYEIILEEHNIVHKIESYEKTCNQLLEDMAVE